VEETIAGALAHGCRKIDIYFMVGLPGETDEDIGESVNMINKLQDMAGKYGARIFVSLNQFVPKPATSFENFPFMDMDEAYERVKKMQAPFLNSPVVKFKVESLREMFLQAFLSRAPRFWSKYLLKYYKKSSSTIASRLLKIKDPSLNSLIFTPIPGEALPPWKVCQ